MINKSNTPSKGWLAFELNVLRRLKFQTAAIPITGETGLGAALKRLNVRVLANDITQWSWTKATAEIQNNGETLADEDIAEILYDAYVPGHKLQNPSTRNWFNETDSWWFDNVRQNIDRLESPITRAIALTVGMQVGDYALSFEKETLHLRQPLSNIYKRFCSVQPKPFNNGEVNTCSNKVVNDFVAENYTDLMFLRLPRIRSVGYQAAMGLVAWREEWIRGGDDFWSEIESAQTGKIGTHVETKTQYLKLVEDILNTASHTPHWAIAHVEDGFVSTQDIVEIISQIRRVDTIFTKDFSELTGMKAVIVTA